MLTPDVQRHLLGGGLKVFSCHHVEEELNFTHIQKYTIIVGHGKD